MDDIPEIESERFMDWTQILISGLALSKTMFKLNYHWIWFWLKLKKFFLVRIYDNINYILKYDNNY